MNRSSVFVILLVGILSGCVGVTPEQLRAQTIAYVQANDRPDFVRDALLNLQPARGMNWADIEYLYGKPARINRSSYTVQAVYRQACQYSRTLYQENIYIYFDGDEVTEWQLNDCIY